MKYIKLKGKKIPAIALGTWSWGTGINGGNKVFGNEYTEDDLEPVFKEAMQKGFNLWDTAAVYGMGASETILGKLIEKEKNIIISTKFTPMGIQTKSAMRKSLNKSLKRLGIKSVDIYWIHNPKNIKKWTREIIPIVKSSKVKYIGVSNHNLEEIKEASTILKKEGLELSAVQNHYSLLYRESEEAGIIDWCHNNDVAFFSYMILEQGALSGKYNVNNPFISGTRRGKAFNSEVLGKIGNLIEAMGKIGTKYQVEPAVIAIAWALSKGTVPVIGVTKRTHIDGAISALDIKLEESDITVLEKEAKDTGVLVKASWEKSMI
ncbi:aldo/keto reductase [Clostridium sp.]|uniref:aldo/keto reductase n=1 Tax=Clostridium sp. TaxID=1506 RepID=UPI002604BD1F|nr:aldo/keto reductase [Clostridium sp.]